MPFISILGCDGSGKSAVIQSLVIHLQADTDEVVCGHLRPKAFASESTDSALISADDPRTKSSWSVFFASETTLAFA